MPSSKEITRVKAHSRSVSCNAFERSDGLWDIEGRMVDIKTFGWLNRDRGGVIPAGEPLHDMSLCLTIDLDYKIHKVVASIDFAPQNICQDIVEVYKRLEGHSIGPGWVRLTKRLFGGVAGCTHLRELLGPVATTAIQALYKPRRLRSLKQQGLSSEPDQLIFGSPEVINSCHAWDESGPAVQEHWPEHYKANK